MRAHSGAAHPAPLMGAQLVFNVGFYAVVPFIAVVLTEDFALAGSAVGLVLGIRTFAQQGMFLLGGALADRFGARAVILTGCAVRGLGFSALALAVHPEALSLPVFVTGTVLTGLGGALFSPALNTLVAAAEQARRPPRPGTNRPTLFAVLTVVGETGAGIGPVLGAALLGWGFATVAWTGAGLFVLVGLVLTKLLPAPPAAGLGTRTQDCLGEPAPATASGASTWKLSSLTHRPFMAFAALHSVELLAYNQLYLGLPVELRRAGSGAEALAGLFVLVSVMTITLQLPVAKLARRVGSARALRAGYLCSSGGFLVLAVSAPLTPPQGGELVPAVTAVVLLVLGHLLASPTALEAVPWFAGPAPLGSYYGLLATCGGITVLLGNVVIGSLYEHAEAPQPSAAVAWAVLAALPLLAAVAVPRIIAGLTPHRPERSAAEATATPAISSTVAHPSNR